MKLIEQEKKTSLKPGKKTLLILKFLIMFYFTMKATSKHKFGSCFMETFFRFSHKKETHFTMAEFDSKLSFP